MAIVGWVLYGTIVGMRGISKLIDRWVYLDLVYLKYGLWVWAVYTRCGLSGDEIAGL